MIPNTIGHYFSALESVLQKLNVTTDSILWINNGKDRISYTDFVSGIKQKDTHKKTATWEGLMVVGTDWWVHITYTANSGKAFGYDTGKIIPEKMSEYLLFQKREENKTLLTGKTAKSFFT